MSLLSKFVVGTLKRGAKAAGKAAGKLAANPKQFVSTFRKVGDVTLKPGLKAAVHKFGPEKTFTQAAKEVTKAASEKALPFAGEKAGEAIAEGLVIAGTSILATKAFDRFTGPDGKESELFDKTKGAFTKKDLIPLQTEVSDIKKNTTTLEADIKSNKKKVDNALRIAKRADSRAKDASKLSKEANKIAKSAVKTAEDNTKDIKRVETKTETDYQGLDGRVKTLEDA